MLSAIGLVATMARRRVQRHRVTSAPMRMMALVSVLAGVTLAVRALTRRRGTTACEDERNDGIRQCARYEGVTHLVCVGWWWVRFPICWLICLLRWLRTRNEVSFPRTECIYGWTAAYRITEESDCRLNVVVRIRLQPDAGITQAQIQAAQNTWEPAIEQAWTGQFPIQRSLGHCACERYSVSLDVQWVTSGEHHVVQVHAGSGRADMGNFFLNSTGGTVAHEVGHMLGNPDEYSDPGCPGRIVTSDNSIMQTTTGTVRPRHYQGFADWIRARTCCRYVVAEH